MKRILYILLAACAAGLAALMPLAVQAADFGLSHAFTKTGGVMLVASHTGVYFDEQQKGSLYCRLEIEDPGAAGGDITLRWQTKGATSATITPEPGVIAPNKKGRAVVENAARGTWFVLTAKAADGIKIKCKVHIPDLAGSGGSSGSGGTDTPPCDEPPPPPCDEPPSYEPPGHPDYEQPEHPSYEPPGHPDYHPSDSEPCEQNVPT